MQSVTKRVTYHISHSYSISHYYNPQITHHITVLHYYYLDITYHTSHIMHDASHHITHPVSHHTSCMGASGCLTCATQCHPLCNFIRKISIEIPYRAPLCGVKRTELPGSGSARVRLPLVAVHSEHAVALNERHALYSTCQVTKQYVAHRVRASVQSVRRVHPLLIACVSVTRCAVSPDGV